MELFTIILPFYDIFTKSSILDVWLGSECTFELGYEKFYYPSCQLHVQS